MIYAYDNWALMPSVDLYDTLMMAMALNAAKDMYEKGEQRIKDFKKEYGDFMTPILADQDWYNQNVTGKINNRLNLIYARGGDPLRNALDRAEIQLLINSIDVGSIAKLRSSAENAREYLKERARLEAAGLYNPDLEKYAGPGLESFSTLDNGIWGRMSPVPYQNMADFSKSYFDNIQPFERAASKNGISYSISEISMPDLHRIADQHFNDLSNTPQGRLMMKYYTDVARGDKDVARQMFNDAVVSGNTDRLRYSDNYNEMRKAEETLRLQKDSNRLAWAKFNWDKQKDAAELQIKAMAAAAKSGDKSAGRNYLSELFIRGQQVLGYGAAGYLPETENDIRNLNIRASNQAFENTQPLRNSKNKDDYHKAQEDYLKKTVHKGILDPSVLANGLGREKNKKYSDAVFARPGDVERLFDDDELTSMTLGGKMDKTQRFHTDRSDFERYRNGNLTIQFTEETYTAPIVDGTNGKKGSLQQFQRVYVINPSGTVMGKYWFRVQKGKDSSFHTNETGVDMWEPFDSSWSMNDAGEMQAYSSSIEKYLNRGKNIFDNSETVLP